MARESILRLLHISDLHARGGRETDLAGRERALGTQWLKNLRDLTVDRPVDLLCMTGDVADWGKPEEYQDAGKFIHRTIEHLGLDTDRVFITPGNHDIDRDVNSATWSQFRVKRPQADPGNLSRWIRGSGKTPLGFS